MSEIISCTHKVTLDIAKRDVHMIQVIYGDTANILEVNLCENGKEIPLENATLATITYSNNTFDEMQISEDYKTASVRINANCLKQGLNFAQISIYSGDNGLITADMLTIDCNQKIGGDNPSCPNADMPKLKELINQLIQQGMADGISPEQIADAVSNYLAKNPIEETDPNVHEWAKAKEKPTYTAEEVGALSEETLKPAVDLALAQAKASGEFDGADGKSAYQYAQDGGYTGTEEEFAEKLAAEKFANPNALTFTGAVEGSYDGSAPLSVEIPSGGGNKGWTLLYDGTITIEEAVKTVTDSLLSPCDGMVDFIGYITWTANANTENGMDSISISVGKANMDYGRIGGSSNAGNSVFQATVTSSHTYWGRANTPTALMFNVANMQYGFSKNANNANYENVTIGFFAKTYAGTITLQLHGR